MYAKARLLTILLTVTTVSLGAEVIRVRVVDGRNGRTITDEHAQVWINVRKGNSLNLVPGADGTAELEAPAGTSIIIQSNFYKDCRLIETGSAGPPTYSVDEITSSGLATQNTCGKLKGEARRGELIFFVRPLHW